MAKAVDTHQDLQKDSTSEIKECFVIMPFRDYEGYDTGHYRRVFEDLIKPACEKANLVAIREDDGNAANLIHLSMLQKIVDRPIAICDLSNLNPNVLYELGIRQAFDKPTVLIKDDNTPNIFDLSPIRYVNYKRSLKYRNVIDEQEKIRDALVETIASHKSENGINSLVRLLFLSKAAEIPQSTADQVNQAMLQTILYEIKNIKENYSLGSIVKNTQSTIQDPSIIPGYSRLIHQLQKLRDSISAGKSNEMIEHDYRRIIRFGEELLAGPTSDWSMAYIKNTLNDAILTYRGFQESIKK